MTLVIGSCVSSRKEYYAHMMLTVYSGLRNIQVTDAIAFQECSHCGEYVWRNRNGWSKLWGGVHPSLDWGRHQIRDKTIRNSEDPGCGRGRGRCVVRRLMQPRYPLLDMRLWIRFLTVHVHINSSESPLPIPCGKHE